MKILYLVHDLADPAVGKRLAMLQKGGAVVTVMGFRRTPEPVPDIGDSPTIDLGQTYNGQFVQRIGAIIRAALMLKKHRAVFMAADVILARNLEMLALGVRGRSLCASKPVLVYESLDIHRLLLHRSPIGMALRWLEGWLAARATALITSSPAFISEYFQKLSRVRLPIRLVENKVFINDFADPQYQPINPLAPARGRGQRRLSAQRLGEVGEGESLQSEAVSIQVRSSHTFPLTLPRLSPDGLRRGSPLPQGEGKEHQSGPPWRIGWYGAIRCPTSLRILTRLTETGNGAVEVVIRGSPALDQFEDFANSTTRTPFLRYLGPYANPGDLAAIYKDVHFTWAIDRFEAGQNSAWLLPNRLYEGGLYGAVPLAEQAVETGRFLDRLGIGVTLAEPLEDSLAAFFSTLTAGQYRNLATRAAAVPQSTWAYDKQDCIELVQFLSAMISPR